MRKVGRAPYNNQSLVIACDEAKLHSFCSLQSAAVVHCDQPALLSPIGAELWETAGCCLLPTAVKQTVGNGGRVARPTGPMRPASISNLSQEAVSTPLGSCSRGSDIIDDGWENRNRTWLPHLLKSHKKEEKIRLQKSGDRGSTTQLHSPMPPAQSESHHATRKTALQFATNIPGKI
ncbi:hypothetical protein B0T24DRAFT_287574 [Lasiosphaeria ovina]|uniref:Uncharacterized protein n=1 Tax=Lasiosphaeria ovina TaxID=92902 RepID=A0AAE0KDB7_9PEZI|nr:hypothetical protein B0T24DRAFT_287574 [Lasiosphaeria ovina]